ncbi:alkaline phosphatase synthesis sensor protein PhoR [Paenibacillus larvae subsp. larvae]|uniref:histidine kinase n=1 Tax=Paenibacillus larvae subsp. larvae TaxID=147375 RepID=A0A2L1U207_9BACL|nr:ATP-binding protein [Paenibacillus larvae]AQT83715.1 hypothetical protein B1222_03695 [Paenibacillus larvae subsp. pulvifaciens]AVF26961.1 alkaline phosphatase synthesis sensor protein PhoR [Paenibacillus larvae subsp. larvae]AVF31708.1 alkaline phosphatase synthesis sensor protein PhoR [Paenibacillus larvae subsp. larvae]MBH0342300.1 hypothetical protein [Paenibacillus larvae]MCY7521533.1 ATP-binding protein [Paenibacillus larvae]
MNILIADDDIHIYELIRYYLQKEGFKVLEAKDGDTRKESGTGLGLSIVKKIIDLHEGNITVNTEVNKGTAFHIVLPHV